MIVVRECVIVAGIAVIGVRWINECDLPVVFRDTLILIVYLRSGGCDSFC